MTITTLRPDNTISEGAWTIVGETSLHDALSDDSDASYGDTSSATEARLSISDMVLPATDLIRAVRTRVRFAAGPAQFFVPIDVGQRMSADAIRYERFTANSDQIGVAEGSWHSRTPDNKTWTESLASILQCMLKASGPDQVHVHELFIDVEHFPKPTVVIDSPTGTVGSTSSPDVSWTYTHAEFAQDAYEVMIRTQDGSTILWHSNVVASAASSTPIGINLENGTYQARVRVRANWGGTLQLWSDWVTQQFTVDTTPAAVPTLVSLGVDPETGIGSIRIDDNSTSPAAEFFNVERRIGSSGTWERIVDEVAAAPQVTIEDTSLVPYETVYYRGQSVRYEGSDPIVSSMSNEVTLLSEIDTWFLRDITGDLGSLALDVEMDSLELDWSEDQASYAPLGQGGASKVGHVTVRGALRGDKFSVTVGMVGDTDYLKFKQFREAQRTLALQAPMVDGFWYIDFDASIKVKVHNLNPPVYRQITFGVKETDRPPNVSH